MNPSNLIAWDVYEIHTSGTAIHGVKLRGRIRKFGIENGMNVLCENATDLENCVRFAVMAHESPEPLDGFLSAILPDHRITMVLRGVANPVLSKLKVNSEERYSIDTGEGRR